MPDSFQFTPVVQVAAGFLLLLMGRQLFWAFVAAVGFFLGAQYGAGVFAGSADAMLLLSALVLGLIGAVLAIVLQRFAVLMAGGIAGGMIALRIAPLVGLHTEQGLWAAFFAGALLAAVLLAVLFDPTLIVISALLGAVMIAEALSLNSLDGAGEPLVLFVLVAFGVFFQARKLRSSPRETI